MSLGHEQSTSTRASKRKSSKKNGDSKQNGTELFTDIIASLQTQLAGLKEENEKLVAKVGYLTGRLTVLERERDGYRKFAAQMGGMRAVKHKSVQVDDEDEWLTEDEGHGQRVMIYVNQRDHDETERSEIEIGDSETSTSYSSAGEHQITRSTSRAGNGQEEFYDDDHEDDEISSRLAEPHLPLNPVEVNLIRHLEYQVEQLNQLARTLQQDLSRSETERRTLQSQITYLKTNHLPSIQTRHASELSSIKTVLFNAQQAHTKEILALKHKSRDTELELDRTINDLKGARSKVAELEEAVRVRRHLILTLNEAISKAPALCPIGLSGLPSLATEALMKA